MAVVGHNQNGPQFAKVESSRLSHANAARWPTAQIVAAEASREARLPKQRVRPRKINDRGISSTARPLSS